MKESLVQTIANRIPAAEAAAFGELYHHFHARLRQFYSIIKTNESAEEIMHEVFAKVWKQRSSCTNRTAMGPVLIIMWNFSGL
jgi:DNA-directed RNA polymerase specialized sigma24 family protein